MGESVRSTAAWEGDEGLLLLALWLRFFGDAWGEVVMGDTCGTPPPPFPPPPGLSTVVALDAPPAVDGLLGVGEEGCLGSARWSEGEEGETGRNNAAAVRLLPLPLLDGRDRAFASEPPAL